METFNRAVDSEKLESLAFEAENPIVVRVSSFSFHRGALEDETGNGGGFVFDARNLPNPGREDCFKTLTGKDAPVADYLSQQESVQQFLSQRDVPGGCQRQ